MVPRILAKVKVKISNPTEVGRPHETELLIDSRAVYTLVNGNALRKVGIVLADKMDFHSINNQRLTRGVGVAIVELLRRRWLTNTIFGEGGDNEVLGVTTLEQLGLQVDPVKKEIKPLPLHLL